MSYLFLLGLSPMSVFTSCVLDTLSRYKYTRTVGKCAVEMSNDYISGRGRTKMITSSETVEIVFNFKDIPHPEQRIVAMEIGAFGFSMTMLLIFVIIPDIK